MRQPASRHHVLAQPPVADLKRKSVAPPFFSGLLAGAGGLLVKFALGGRLAAMPYLTVGLGVVLGIYAWVLLIVMRQMHVYMDLLSQLLPRLGRRQEGGVELAVRLP